MIQSLVLTTGVAFAIVQLALINESQVQATGPFNNFKELYTATVELNSVELVLEQKDEQANLRRTQLLNKFERETKRDKCSDYETTFKRLADEFKIKAKSYISDCNSGKNNWFVNAFTGGPLGGMKNAAKNSPFLSELAHRYEIQGKKYQLNETNVDCDMLEFRIRNLDPIFVVLTTDVRYLVIEDPQTLNKNIRFQIHQDKMIATHDYYKIRLSNEQKRLLFEYFAHHKDLTSIDVEEALEHFNNPSNLITGRLLDSCEAITGYKFDWDQLEHERTEVCRYSKVVPDDKAIPSEIDLNKYEHTIEFCQNLLDSITL